MELMNEKDAGYTVRHTVTEKKLLHLEKGVRKLGFRTGGQKIMMALLGLCLICLIASRTFTGVVAGTLSAVFLLALLALIVCIYSLVKGWVDAKKTIHIQYENGKADDNYDWEFRFYDSCYEVIGKKERSRVLYSHIGRLLEFSGMYVLVERGDVIRYFDKKDVVKGDADELAAFLENKCKIGMELIKVRD